MVPKLQTQNLRFYQKAKLYNLTSLQRVGTALQLDLLPRQAGQSLARNGSCDLL